MTSARRPSSPACSRNAQRRLRPDVRRHLRARQLRPDDQRPAHQRLGGEDRFYSDDTSAIMTIDGGDDDDFFQFGQLFGSPRVSLPDRVGAPTRTATHVDEHQITTGTVAPGDELTTLQTTRGFLSRGISFPAVVYGGDGDDAFVVYSNKALLKLFGEANNDNFLVRAFLLKDDTDARRRRRDRGQRRRRRRPRRVQHQRAALDRRRRRRRHDRRRRHRGRRQLRDHRRRRSSAPASRSPTRRSSASTSTAWRATTTSSSSPPTRT